LQGEADAAGDGEAVCDAVAVGARLADGEPDDESEAVAAADTDAVTEADCEEDAVTLADTDGHRLAAAVLRETVDTGVLMPAQTVPTVLPSLHCHGPMLSRPDVDG